MDLSKSMVISASGMKAQSTRMRIIAENIANAGSVAAGPGQEPYRRKTVSFGQELDKATGVYTVKVDDVNYDKSDFGLRYEPGHPAANKDGYIQTPNVNSLIETMDMKQSQHSYQSNLNALEVSKNMMMRTIDLLR